ncbi:MAG: UpxY family transcription antiterminator [Acidobacteriaceae bacterium]|nr:UpxY family transcription antiterminator [Acidobacteriaceae bacterium]
MSVTESEIYCDTVTERQWFAVFVKSKHEKRVGQHLRTRNIEYFLPSYTCERRWKDGSRQTLRLPLFPNYLFARVTRRERIPVLATPGVFNIVGDAKQSSSVSDAYIQSLREKLLQSGIEPHAYPAFGERVRVKSGLMAGWEGVLVRQKGRYRVVVTLELIRRSVSVELDLNDLENDAAGTNGSPSIVPTLANDYPA